MILAPLLLLLAQPCPELHLIGPPAVCARLQAKLTRQGVRAAAEEAEGCAPPTASIEQTPAGLKVRLQTPGEPTRAWQLEGPGVAAAVLQSALEERRQRQDNLRALSWPTAAPSPPPAPEPPRAGPLSLGLLAQAGLTDGGAIWPGLSLLSSLDTPLPLWAEFEWTQAGAQTSGEAENPTRRTSLGLRLGPRYPIPLGPAWELSLLAGLGLSWTSSATARCQGEGCGALGQLEITHRELKLSLDAGATLSYAIGGRISLAALGALSWQPAADRSFSPYEGLEALPLGERQLLAAPRLRWRLGLGLRYRFGGGA